MNKQALCNYKRIVIFSGTSDGRILSEELAKRGIYHTVCVATDYGDLMQPKNEYTLIHEGRMDEEKMREYMDEGSMIIDATHPYATEVTANIRSAANNKSCEYIRIVRESAQSIDSDVLTDDSRLLNRQYYNDYESMAHALNDVEGNILITTGSKELKKLTSIVRDTDKLYVRVLPSLDSIRLCEQAGIRNDHIIAMHGPFNEEINTALLRQYNISCLVTKESGTRGGFMEKLSAAAKVGASCYICGRPTMEEGLSVDDALLMAMSYAAKELKNTNNSNNPGVIRLVVNIIGMGMGSPDCITVGAKKAIDDSDIVFGAARLIEEIDDRKYPYYLAADILPVIFEHYKMHDSVCLNECGHNSNELTVSVLFADLLHCHFHHFLDLL